MNNEQKIWQFLKSKLQNECGAAGVMGNLYAESGLKSNNLQDTYNKSLGYTDEQYTAAVDEKKYQNFISDSAGYGLAQWTYHTRKENLLKYANEHNKSIGDLDMQLDYLWKELSTEFALLVSQLKNVDSVDKASDLVLTKFEKPKD